MLQIRPATLADIPAMHEVRVSVRENRLSNPNRITPADYAEMLQGRGAGWVAEQHNQIVGFAFVDERELNVWALFLLPEVEGRGIGRALQAELLAYCAHRQLPSLWLSTAPGTRAEGFYEATGWTRTGLTAGGEMRFERTIG